MSMLRKKPPEIARTIKRSGIVSLLFACLVSFSNIASAGVIQPPVWIKDTETLGYYSISAGQIVADEVHNPGTSKSPNEFWEVTVTAITEDNRSTIQPPLPDRVNANGSMTHITAVTDHDDELPLGGQGNFDLTVVGQNTVDSNDDDTHSNTNIHTPDHMDYFGFRLKTSAPFGGNDISGTTLSTVGYHFGNELIVEDQGDFDLDTDFDIDDLIKEGTKKSVKKNNSSESGFEKTISPTPGSPISLSLIDYNFEYEIGAEIGSTNVFDAFLSDYLFEFTPFDVGSMLNINRQILDPDQILSGLFDRNMELLLLPAKTLWLNTSGNVVAKSEELFVFDLITTNGMVEGYEMISRGTFVPEPTSIALFAIGLAGLAWVRLKMDNP